MYTVLLHAIIFPETKGRKEKIKEIYEKKNTENKMEVFSIKPDQRHVIEKYIKHEEDLHPFFNIKLRALHFMDSISLVM